MTAGRTGNSNRELHRIHFTNYNRGQDQHFTILPVQCLYCSYINVQQHNIPIITIKHTVFPKNTLLWQHEKQSSNFREDNIWGSRVFCFVREEMGGWQSGRLITSDGKCFPLSKPLQQVQSGADRLSACIGLQICVWEHLNILCDSDSPYL